MKLVRDPLTLTARQREIRDWIASFIVSHQYPPSLREIGAAFGIRSTNGVSDHLIALEKKLAITWTKKRRDSRIRLARTLRVLP